MNQEMSVCKEANWENEYFNANEYLCQSTFQRLFVSMEVQLVETQDY